MGGLKHWRGGGVDRRGRGDGGGGGEGLERVPETHYRINESTMFSGT